MLKKILFFIGGLIFLLVGIGFFLPSAVRMDRSVEIAASPKVVFEQINSFKNFNKWSPWAKIDTATQYSYEGPESGLGAKMIWDSEDPNVGKGSQEIVASEPYSRIENKLIFGDFEPASAIFDIEATESGSRVTWSYDQEVGMNIIGRYFGLMMDGMLGPDYEKGLANLKEMIEAMPKYTSEISVESVEAQKYISISEYVDNDPTLISTKMAALYGELIGALQRSGVNMEGYPFAIYRDYSDTGMTIECALPISSEITLEGDRISLKNLYAGKTVKAIHLGSYDNLANTHGEIDSFISLNGLTVAGDPWEVYITDPETETDTSKWVTHVYYPAN